jgi:putative RNA 2'-phosphotransferase
VEIVPNLIDAGRWSTVGQVPDLSPRAGVEAIMGQGRHPRTRHHAHLSADVRTAVRVGRRRAADAAVPCVAAAEMAADGHVFHRSENRVWLTAAVPERFLSAA